MSTVRLGDASAWAVFGEGGLASPHRYELGRRWADYRSLLYFIGLNPSTATHEQLDPTLRRVAGYAGRWGYDGFVVLNLYAFRSTEPSGVLRWLRAEPPGMRHAIGPFNDDWLDEVPHGAVVLCGWGATPWAQVRAGLVRERMIARGCKLVTLKRTKSGAPSHPLYLKGDLMPEPF